MRERALRCLEVLAVAATALGALWLLWRFVLPALAPFLMAYLLAALMEPAVRALMRLRLRRAPAAALTTLALLALLLLLAVRLMSRGAAALSGLAASLPELIGAIEQRLAALEDWVLRLTRESPESTAWLGPALEAVGNTLTAVPERLSRSLLDAAAAAAQRSPDALLFLITAGLGSFFLSAAFPKVKAFLLAQLPPAWLRQLETLRQDLRQSLGGFLRAQLWLMLITFAELLAAFLLLGVPGAPLIAAVTALVDALPVFGVGVVLLPWAAVALLRGQMRLGLGLAAAFALISLLRQLLQARLIGSEIGLDPLSSLLAVYVGWKLCGMWGLLLFPLGLATLRQLNDRGLLRLWKAG